MTTVKFILSLRASRCATACGSEELCAAFAGSAAQDSGGDLVRGENRASNRTIARRKGFLNFPTRCHADSHTPR